MISPSAPVPDSRGGRGVLDTVSGLLVSNFRVYTRAMTATRTPGVPAIDEGSLISTSPATGAEIGRFPVASPDHVTEAVARARDAAGWWAGLGFTGRRKRLLAFRSVLTNRLEELAELM